MDIDFEIQYRIKQLGKRSWETIFVNFCYVKSKRTLIDGEIYHVHGSEESIQCEYTTQSNLQIQYNPYQATNGIFQSTRTNNFIICIEIQNNLVEPEQS